MSLLMSKAMDGDRDDVRDDVDATEPLQWSLLRRSASGDNLSALQSATTSGVSSSEGTEWGVTAEHAPRAPREPDGLDGLDGLNEHGKCSQPTLGVPSSSLGRGEGSRGHRVHLSTPTRGPLA